MKKGELLWQGKEIGLCVSGDNCNRAINEKTTVHCLQSDKLNQAFSSPYIIPLEGLIADGIINFDNFTENEKNILDSFFNSLTEQLSNN